MKLKTNPTEIQKEAPKDTKETGYWDWFVEFEKKLKISLDK